MLRISNPVSKPVQSPGLSHRLPKLLVQFWRFSQFYGDYQSLPPAERRQFVIDRQKQSR